MEQFITAFEAEFGVAVRTVAVRQCPWRVMVYTSGSYTGLQAGKWGAVVYQTTPDDPDGRLELGEVSPALAALTIAILEQAATPACW